MNYSSDYFRKHLNKVIIPFWSALRDDDNGGYYGYMSRGYDLDKNADKGMILNSRILWFYSNCYTNLKDDPNRDEYLSNATHAYEFLRSKGMDKDYPGIYWMLDYKGEPVDTTKHSYNQAFAIYALSSYYEASGDSKAKEIALNLYDILESRAFSGDGYEECFVRDYSGLVDNDKLSENGVIATRTMNTLLHIWEAYTELYRVLDDSDSRRKDVGQSLVTILNIFVDKVYEPENRRLGVFFDNEYNSLLDLYSYGHDIEASWLINRGLDVLGDVVPAGLVDTIQNIIDTMIAHVYEEGYDSNRKAVMAECENGVDAVQKIWWVQAESIIGFTNGYERDNSHVEYRQAAEDIWQFTLNEIVEDGSGREWIQETDSEAGNTLPMVSPWKCPYHNGRMCLEMIKRLG